MIPLSLDPRFVQIGLAGAGVLALRRLRGLRAAGAPVLVYTQDAALAAEAGASAQAGAPDLAALHVLYIVGLPDAEAQALAVAARDKRVLVNVEDVPAFCDFHSVAEVRRGDLLLTVSTNGAAPGLAGTIRRGLEACFPAEWAGRVDEVAALRRGWRAEGVKMPEAAARIEALVDERCWLNCPRPG
jgi:precorrin-2 dehydrogenase/sirohydrochlorin ferrochelatase